MKLHHDSSLFSQVLRSTSQHFNIKLRFVEKDYYITNVLYHLSSSQYRDDVVFKGGTSLSKGYNLIDRFSEDVDLAIIHNTLQSGNIIKTLIRNVEKTITPDLIETPTKDITSKGSRFRKSIFKYNSFEPDNGDNKIIVEINSFANPFPYQPVSISSMEHDFLLETNNVKYINDYILAPFTINVLNINQTLLEKIVSLIRVSYDLQPIMAISGKIRHFYDLYYLMQTHECIEYFTSKKFTEDFFQLLMHDKEMFDVPLGWKHKTLNESPLISNFDSIWKELHVKYQSELSALAYRTIPNEKEVARQFSTIIQHIRNSQ